MNFEGRTGGPEAPRPPLRLPSQPPHKGKREAGTCGPAFPKNVSPVKEKIMSSGVNEVRCDCWESFETQVSSIFTDLEKKRQETGLYVSPPLFRGHAKESWKLKTTLERYSEKEYSIRDYYQILLAVEPAVASCTSKSWNLSPDVIIDKMFPFAPPPEYDFMIYLRHHGFPSPLLDWSSSPYVAAFFAFQPRPEKEDKNIAIYSYVEYYGYPKGEISNQTYITRLGPRVHTDKRHFIQQCMYTICAQRAENNYYYCNHEEAFNTGEKEHDILTKYLIPRSERPKVLSKLDLMNINSYSLFINEESLMETLAYQEIEKKIINTYER